MKKSLISYLLLLCLIAVLLSSSFTLLSAGAESTARMVYSTDFESVNKKNDAILDMGIDNLFVFDNPNAIMFIDDGSKRPNSPVPHSGSRDIGLEITKGYRNEFNLMNMQNLVQKELFISVWLYLPADFQMHMPSANWFEIINPFITAETFTPYFALHINQETSEPNFSLELYQRDLNRDLCILKDVPIIDLPRGRWFSLQYYVYHDAIDGIIKVWLDDPMMQNQPIIAVNGLEMASPSSTAWYTTIAKIYHDPKDTYSPYQLWVDDLEVWNGMPPQRLNINVWTEKGDNSQLPIYWGCLGSYKKGETISFNYRVNKDSQGTLKVIDSAGSVKTLANGPLSQGASSINLLLNGPTGYWRADFSVEADGESNADSIQFWLVQDYIKFRGVLLSTSRSATSGNFYQVKVTEVLESTEKISVNDQFAVHWNYSLAEGDLLLDEGSYVEVYGGYVPSSVDGFSEAIVLANSDDYIKWVMTHEISVDPKNGRIYIDNETDPIATKFTYNWLDGSMHKLYAEPAFESEEDQFIFSKWSDGNNENPRTVNVSGSAEYTALWIPAQPLESVLVLSPSNATFTTGTVALTLSVNASTRWLGYSLDGAANISVAGNTTLQGLPSGTHNLIVYAEDYFGNIAKSASISFVINTENVYTNWIIVGVLISVATIVIITIVLGYKKFKKQTYINTIGS